MGAEGTASAHRPPRERGGLDPVRDVPLFVKTLGYATRPAMPLEDGRNGIIFIGHGSVQTFEYRTLLRRSEKRRYTRTRIAIRTFDPELCLYTNVLPLETKGTAGGAWQLEELRGNGLKAARALARRLSNKFRLRVVPIPPGRGVHILLWHMGTEHI